MTPEILQRFVRVERTVLLPSTQHEVDPFWLQNFRPAVVVMTVSETVPEEAAPVAPAP